MARRLLLAVVAAAAAVVVVAPAGQTAPPALAPVPSLEPAATERAWRELVRRPRLLAAEQACPATTHVSFYAATDWLRLATTLASVPAPCTEVHVSVPPLAADKTQFRSDQAWRIRALGSSFHALADVSFTGWSGWVSAGNGSWYDAGVEARRRLAAAGFDVALGDRWALNELSSAVRAGTGAARANVLELLRGLHDGPPGAADIRGLAFVAGIGQRTAELSLYQARLQDWLEDGSFWQAAGAYVADWGQEQYGDVRAWAVPGTDLATRRERLADYLAHDRLLARAEPGSAATARAFLEAAHAPIGNAAWSYDASFGWTAVPVELMQDYVSAQVDALHAFGAGRFGFAWSPRNPGLSSGDFTTQTAALLRRLADALADPSGGCAPAWCLGVLDGSAFNTGWQAFRAWRPSQLAFTSPPPVLEPGAVSPPLTVELRTHAGLPYETGLPLAVTFSSTSAGGAFAPAPEGPWTPTLALAIPGGARSVAAYYRDAEAGAPTLTAAAAGRVAATAGATVGAPPPPPGGGGGGPPPDTVPPETVIASAPSGVVASTAATVVFTSEPGARFECSLDGAPFGGCVSPLQLAGLPQGPRVLDVRAVDAAGNADPTPVRAAWLVDTVRPGTRLDTAPSGVVATRTAEVAFSADEAARFECSLDRTAFAPCSSPLLLRGLAQGPHVLAVRAVDGAGNADATPVRAAWAVDTVAPATRITSFRRPTRRSAAFRFGANEERVRFECSLDGRAFTRCPSPKGYFSLAPGRHVLRVRATDRAGNTDPTPALAAWRV